MQETATIAQGQRQMTTAIRGPYGKTFTDALPDGDRSRTRSTS